MVPAEREREGKKRGFLPSAYLASPLSYLRKKGEAPVNGPDGQTGRKEKKWPKWERAEKKRTGKDEGS